MRKTALACAVVFLLTCGTAGASSVNGDFDGNPIVKVQSAGQELKVDDVPATIYKGRTVVPIYLLRQLGASVDWNQNTYTVNVSLPAGDTGSASGSGTSSSGTTSANSAADAAKPDPAAQERQTIKNAYEWLKDTDTAINMFVDELQQLGALDSSSANTAMLDTDLKRLTDLFNESLQMSLKIGKQLPQHYDDLQSIVTSESKLLDQVTQLTNLLKTKQSNPGIDITKSFGISWLNAYRAAQQNLLHTNDLLHNLQAEEMNYTK
jgi:hypothetical protein